MDQEFYEAGKRNNQEKVRSGYLSRLPESIRTKVMEIHKIINAAVDTLLDDDHYGDLKDSSWAMSCIDEFRTMPKDKSDVGSFQVFRKGKTYKCVIQITGQFRNHQYGWIEELLHEFLCDMFQSVRPKVRKKFDVTLTNDGRTGNPFEGYNVTLSAKISKEIWDLLDDVKEQTSVKTESADTWPDVFEESVNGDISCDLRKLPKGLAMLVSEMNNAIKSLIETQSGTDEFKVLGDNLEELRGVLHHITGKDTPNIIGNTTITLSPAGVYSGEVIVTPEFEQPLANKLYSKLFKVIEKKLAARFAEKNPGKRLVLTGEKDKQYFVITLDNDYAKRLAGAIKSGKTKAMKESAETPEYNVGMSEAEAKKTLRAVSQQLINDFQKDKSKKMTQYTANIYANVITKNLLSKWAGGFSRLTITLDDYQSFHTVEFKVPKMTLDFVGRFIQGRETIDGFLHRQPEIKMKISPRVFHTMKNPDDAYNFFKAAINYYDKKLGAAGQKLMAEAMKLTPAMKHLISTTKLSGIVTYPMQLLFIFDDVQMDAKDTFTLSADDVRTVSSFIKNIASHYAAPEKEKKKIIEDVQKMVKTLREAASMDENIRELHYLPEAVSDLYAGKFNQQMKEATEAWQESNVDTDGMRKWGHDLQYMREAFGVRKLKKIPMDTVAYIQIETECIKDANDKMMISSYCLSKIEIVEWYIELLDVGSKKYIVPHNKPYLTSLRTQLLACFKKIMATPIPKTTDRPLIDIQYPKGYEG